MRPLTITCVLGFILLFCNSCEQKEKNRLPTYQGLWEQPGYGRILAFKDSTLKVYDINKVSCMLTFEEDILDFASIVHVDEDTLILEHGIDLWKCVRIDSLPALCTVDNTKEQHDPFYNFDVLWQNFYEHYSSFHIKGIDWELARKEYRDKLNSETTDLELFLIIEEMTNLLEDGHIKLPVPDELTEEYERVTDIQSSRFNILDELEINRTLAEIYVDSLRSVNAGMTNWGMIEGNTGYVQINAMWVQADYDVDRNLNFENFYGQYREKAGSRKDEEHRQDEADGMRKTLDMVLEDLAGAERFIIDLRFNGGGKDGVAMEILHHFSSVNGKVASKYAKDHSGYTSYQDIKNRPSTNGFQGPVYILISHRTASAAELTVLGSLADKNFTRVGSNTEGIFSSTLDKVLPNGWAYEFSNEIYEDLRGENYEHVGIPPDIEMTYPLEKDKFLEQMISCIESEKDPAIEYVLQSTTNH